MILLLGNCQVCGLHHILQRNGAKNLYLANTERIDPQMDVDAIFDHVSRADIVVTQPIFNENNPLHFSKIQALTKHVVFVPYLVIDGLFSLCATSEDSNVFRGEEKIDDSYFDCDPGKLLQDFLKGRVEFAVVERFTQSLAELKYREAASGAIVMSDYITEHYKEQELFLTYCHPKSHLLDILCARLCEHLDLPYRPFATLSPEEQAAYLFNSVPRVRSPYDVEKLGLNYQADDQWWPSGSKILNIIWKKRAESVKSNIHKLRQTS